MTKLLIAVDGPSAAGKGTLCSLLSNHFNIPHLNTGGLYRGTTYKAIQQGIDLNDSENLAEIARNLTTDDINNPLIFNEEIGSKTSIVAKIQLVRDALFQYQKDFANNPEGAILDGRDIATVICPNADYKFYVTASPEERAKRRYNEMINKNKLADYDTVLKQIIKRDEDDLNRENSPMKKADDAILIDTTDKTIQKAFEFMLSFIDIKE